MNKRQLGFLIMGKYLYSTFKSSDNKNNITNNNGNSIIETKLAAIDYKYGYLIIKKQKMYEYFKS